jgi:hypothetical protein
MAQSTETNSHGTNVLALTGLRVDAENASVARFPLANVGSVRERVRRLVQESAADIMVTSAACGAHLLALEVADEFGLGVDIILPFTRDRFRIASVTDRPGNWGPLFDRLIDAAERNGAVHFLTAAASHHDAYLQLTWTILQRAMELVRSTRNGRAASQPGIVTAVVVWDGNPRGPDDVTAAFVRQAQSKHLALREVNTLAPK